ncbi:MAG TPA: hypothetical protein VH724_14300 [Candidatus Angelobacter sp.]|nr:hypothetical protein [Candidatus Angelobacter sp.]
MKNRLAAKVLISAAVVFVLVFALGYNLAAQSRSVQRTQATTASAGRTDLNSTLIDLDRVAQATQSDIANMHVEKWKSGWKSGFLKDGSHKEQAQQAAGSLQRNLANALPGLIHDVQSTRGSISTTFKLYDDVSLVCEAVDSLIAASEGAGKKSDAAPLVDDFSALARIRRSLSNYIQQASSTLETKGRAPYALVAPQPLPTAAQQSAAPRQITAASSPQAIRPQVITDNQGVKKIIIDDTIPEKKSAAPAPKKKPVTLSNLE